MTDESFSIMVDVLSSQVVPDYVQEVTDCFKVGFSFDKNEPFMEYLDMNIGSSSVPFVDKEDLYF